MLTDNVPPAEENQPDGWPDGLKVHPAAAKFPMMKDGELDALGTDIREHGLKHGLVLWIDAPSGAPRPKPKESMVDWCKRIKIPVQLLDGRNRLAAVIRENSKTPGHTPEDVGADDCLPLVQDLFEEGYDGCAPAVWLDHYDNVDPVDYVISANIHRRHLAAEEKDPLIAAVLKLKPEMSNRAVAKVVNVDHHKVAKVRAEGEATGEIAPVEKRVGGDGKARKQPPHKPPTAATPEPEAAPSEPAKEEPSQPAEPATSELEERLEEAATVDRAGKPYPTTGVVQFSILSAPTMIKWAGELDDSEWRKFWDWAVTENERRTVPVTTPMVEQADAGKSAVTPTAAPLPALSRLKLASSPALENAAPTATGPASDTEIMNSQAYRQAVEKLGKEADKAKALAFASSVFPRKRSGEIPQSPTDWEQLCWDMPDAVRSAFVRHNVAPRGA